MYGNKKLELQIKRVIVAPNLLLFSKLLEMQAGSVQTNRGGGRRRRRTVNISVF